MDKRCSDIDGYGASRIMRNYSNQNRNHGLPKAAVATYGRK